MNRRTAFATMFGAPLALAGVELVRVTDRSGVPVEPAAISANLLIHADESGTFFVCELYRKPWPVVGQTITTEYKAFTLVGTVTRTEHQSVHGSDRFRCRIWGTVQRFDALGVVDSDRL